MKKQQKKSKDPFSDINESSDGDDSDSDGEDKNIDLEEDFELKNEHDEFYKEYFKDDEEDSFYDRTGRIEKKRQSHVKETTTTETYDTLLAKVKIITSQIKILQDEVKQLEQQRSSPEDVKNETEKHNDEDALSVYMNSIQSTLSQDKASRKNSLIKELEIELKNWQGLANVVKPALYSPADTPSFTDAQLHILETFQKDIQKRKSDTDDTQNQQDTGKEKKAKETMKILAKEAKEKRLKRKLAEIQAKRENAIVTPDFPPGFIHTPDNNEANGKTPENNTEQSKLPEDTSEMLEKSVPEIESSSDQSIENSEEVEKSETETEQKKRKLDELYRHQVDPLNEDPSKSRKKKKKKQHYDEDSANYSTWVPPVGQTGDGRTHLNDKFGY